MFANPIQLPSITLLLDELISMPSPVKRLIMKPRIVLPLLPEPRTRPSFVVPVFVAVEFDQGCRTVSRLGQRINLDRIRDCVETCCADRDRLDAGSTDIEVDLVGGDSIASTIGCDDRFAQRDPAIGTLAGA